MVQLSFTDHMVSRCKADFARFRARLEKEAEEVGGYDYEEEDYEASRMAMSLDYISDCW